MATIDYTRIAKVVLHQHAMDTAMAPALGRTLSAACLQRLAPGDRMCREGDPGDEMWVLLRGNVEVTKRDLVGQDQQISTIAGPAVLGHVSLVSRVPRSTSLTAVDSVHVAIIDQARFKVLMRDTSPEGDAFRRLLIASLARQLSRGREKLRQTIAEVG